MLLISYKAISAMPTSHHTFSLCVRFCLIHHLQKSCLFTFDYFHLILTNMIWVCHDLVKTKMDSRQKEKKGSKCHRVLHPVHSLPSSQSFKRRNHSFIIVRERWGKCKIPFGTKETHIGHWVLFLGKWLPRALGPLSLLSVEGLLSRASNSRQLVCCCDLIGPSSRCC